jgi:hypothetical protein
MVKILMKGMKMSEEVKIETHENNQAAVEEFGKPVFYKKQTASIKE